MTELSSAWRRPEGRAPLVLAHRGARLAAPENTISAFDLARQSGADGVEIDLRMDGESNVVVFHDKTLARVTQGGDRRHIEGLRSAELARVRIAGEPIPTLEDFLAWARQNELLCNIEIKHDVSHPSLLLRQIRDRLVREPRLHGRVLLSSFHPLVVWQLARSMPLLPVAWLFHKRQRLVSYAPALSRFRASAVHPEYPLLSRARMKWYKRQRFGVNTWTINSAKAAREAAALGVDAIITDTPEHICRALRTPGG